MRQMTLTNRVTGESFQFPSMPKEIPSTHGTTAYKVTLDGLGTHSWPSGREPTEWHFAGTFYGPDREPTSSSGLPFITAYRLPWDCIAILETWHDAQSGSNTVDGLPQRLALTVTGSDTLLDPPPISKDVWISAFMSTLVGGMGDITYDITLTEWRDVFVLRDQGNTPSEGTTPSSDQAAESDPDAPPTPSSYAVQPGDTLSAIANKLLGDAGRWREIYDIPENQAAIGGNPNLIQPNMQLAIPGKGGEPDPEEEAA